MPSPFPGMDPYLEDPEIWSGVHAALLATIADRLGPTLRPKYVVRYEERVYVTSEEDPGYRMIVPALRIVERPGSTPASAARMGAMTIAEPIKVTLSDDEIHERSLVVRDARDRSIVTIMELLSPTNKVPNSFGRSSFLKKRREVTSTDAHWMEIDLLRDGARTANLPGVPETEYQIYLSRAGKPRQGFVWPAPLRERLPIIGIPLRGGDADVALDLQEIVAAVIERGSYDLDADYAVSPVPPLTPELWAWAKDLIAGQSR
jgi:hypothetical protein